MNFHEYQAKALFRDYGIPVPEGRMAASPEDAVSAAQAIAAQRWVVKAQVHAGGRGKGGGIRIVDSLDEVRASAQAMLGSRLITPQTDAAGLPVNSVLVEGAMPPVRELYLGALIDRSVQRITFMASSAGGMDIEAVAASEPEKILTVAAHPITGIQAFQARQLGFALGLDGSQIRQLGQIMAGLYRLFLEKDVSLVEINPLIVTADGKLLALDAKLNLDDNAMFRQAAMADMRDASQEDLREQQAREHELNYVSLDGDIGCLVNGAGLAMATMDLVKLHGGSPANFLDVGGGATAERVTEAFKLILSDDKVKAILVNIFGGIVRCDLIAEGIIEAAGQIGLRVPLVVRLEGTNVEQGKQLLADSGLDLIVSESLTDAAQKVVAKAG